MAGPDLLIDCRSPSEYAERHLDGAVNIPVDELPLRMAELPDPGTVEIGVYCASGSRAERAADILREWGYETRVGKLIPLPQEAKPKADLCPCPECKGTGRRFSLCLECSDTHEHACRTCKGSGKRALAPLALPGFLPSSPPSMGVVIGAFGVAALAVAAAVALKRQDQRIGTLERQVDARLHPWRY